MDNKNDLPLSEEQVKSIVGKRGAHWVQELTPEGGENNEPGTNARFIRHALASWGLPPIDISDPKQVEQRLHEYFQYCVDNDRRPQVIGMCNWLGISKMAITEWKNGVTRSSTHKDIINRAYAVMEEMWIDYMQCGKISPPTAIFLAKNFFGYKDVADVVVTPNNPLQGLDDTQAAERILENKPHKRRLNASNDSDDD